VEGFVSGEPQRIGIIGVGRLGSALARAVVHAGHARVALADSAGARAVAEELGTAAVVQSAVELVAAAELVVLAVPDTALRSVVEALPWHSGCAAVHTCGALDLGVLEAASLAGASRAVLHPLQSFTRGSGAASFVGIAIGLETDSPGLLMTLEALTRRLGARPLSLSGVSRPAYHAAAVFASNYVVSLHAAAARAFELAGLSPDQARAALAPLTLGAAANIADRPLPEALTGPLVRGDVHTVEQHLRALAADPALRALYCALGRQLLGLPLALSPDAHRALDALLGAGGRSDPR
jgi:predicted short-subunit dehydrogenase-like oxidoreductase (DUF2520 family)